MSKTPENDRVRVEVILRSSDYHDSPADLPEDYDARLKAIADGQLPRDTFIVGEAKEARMRRLDGDSVYIDYLRTDSEEIECKMWRAVERVNELNAALAAKPSVAEIVAEVLRQQAERPPANILTKPEFPSVEAIAKAAIEAALQKRAMAPATTEDVEVTECDDGVSLFDVAFALQEDHALARRAVKQWSDSKKIRCRSIGKCPMDARRPLYRLPEILADIAAILSLTRAEQEQLRQTLRSKCRAPRD